MADLRTSFCGIELDNPFIIGSCPLCYSAEGMAEAVRAGAAAVVTKTIMTEAAVNPQPHMVLSGPNSLINTEKWADYPAQQWLEREIPKAKEMGVKVLIANIKGVDTEETIALAKAVVQAGADMVEFSGDNYFDAGALIEKTRRMVQEISVPLIVKVKAKWGNTAEIAAKCIEAGADAITCMDSMGQILRLDVATARPVVGGKNGYGWLTGEAMLPFTLQIVNDIARRTNSDLIGMGGITKGRDALEMLQAGATALGICTAPIIRGLGYIETLKKELSELLDRYGYSSVKEASRRSLEFDDINGDYPSTGFQFDSSKCNHCGRCVACCPYGARTLSEDANLVDANRCRSCGLCFSVCPKGAIQMCP